MLNPKPSLPPFAFHMMEDLPATPSPALASGDWQQQVAARTAPPPKTPWWEELLKSRAVVAVGAAVLALLLLALLKPPIVQQTSSNAFETATLSLPRLAVWSVVVGGLVFAAPYAWAALQRCSNGGNRGSGGLAIVSPA